MHYTNIRALTLGTLQSNQSLSYERDCIVVRKGRFVTGLSIRVEAAHRGRVDPKKRLPRRTVYLPSDNSSSSSASFSRTSSGSRVVSTLSSAIAICQFAIVAPAPSSPRITNDKGATERWRRRYRWSTPIDNTPNHGKDYSMRPLTAEERVVTRTRKFTRANNRPSRTTEKRHCLPTRLSIKLIGTPEIIILLLRYYEITLCSGRRTRRTLALSFRTDGVWRETTWRLFENDEIDGEKNLNNRVSTIRRDVVTTAAAVDCCYCRPRVGK